MVTILAGLFFDTSHIKSHLKANRFFLPFENINVQKLKNKNLFKILFNLLQ